jgi:Flp pilus assembly protein TadD
MQRDARQQMIAAYQQMLTEMNSKPDSTDVRSIHLELAALYRLEGDYEKSNSIYQRFIKKYPREFTFYLGASKLRVAEKKWDEAIQYAEKAVRYSYGDNQIRSVLQLAVAQDQAGKVSDAKQTLTKFLNNYQAPQDDLQVRSKRYLTEVSNFLKHLQEKKP